MELDLKPVSKAARNVGFHGTGMNVHNMVENSYTVDLAAKYRLLMLYLFFSYVLINCTLSLIQTFTATKIECGRQVDGWDYDKIKGFFLNYSVISYFFVSNTKNRAGF